MTDFTARKRYDFKRDLEKIDSLRGMHTELISVYIPANKQISDVTNYLRNEASQASNIKSTQTRKNVQGALESLLSRLRGFRMAPENGLVLFVGAVVTGNNKQDMQAYILEPPEPIKSFVYRCDSTFYTEPLKEFLKEREVYGLILIDRREMTIGLLRGRSVTSLMYDTSQVPGKHGRGGQSQRRMERLIEIAADEWYKKSAEKMNDVFVPMVEDGSLQGLLVGGPGPSKKYFVDSGFVDYRLQPKIIDLFDTGYTDEFGLKELVERAEQTLSKHLITKEKQIMRLFLKEVQQADTGLATYGEAHVRKALEMAAVKAILISEGLRRYRVNVGCSQCDYTEAPRTVKTDDLEGKVDEKCPKCGSRLQFRDPKDLVDDLADLAEQTKADVELISQESEEGDTLMKAFGGIGAILRYKIG